MNRIVGKVSAGLEIVKELVEPPSPAAFLDFAGFSRPLTNQSNAYHQQLPGLGPPAKI